jgi:hypothetical protein
MKVSEMIDISSIRAMSDSTNKAAMQRAIGMIDNPAMQRAIGMIDNPAMQRAIGMIDNPAMQRAIGMIDSPAMQRAIGMIDSPAMQRAIGMIDSPAMQRAIGMIDSPAMRIASDLAKKYAVQIALMRYPDDLFSLGSALSGASIQAKIGSAFAKDIVTSARLAGTLDDIAGRSFIIDTFVAEDFTFEESTVPTEENISKFLESVSASVRRYLSAAHSLPELVGLIQYILIAVGLLNAYFAYEAASHDDIKKLDDSVKTQTLAIQEQFGALRYDVERLVRAKENDTNGPKL